jgi:hypothetical protein
MKPLPTISNAHHRRKIHFVDETLQKFLLIGLVLLETGLAAGLTWLMFSRLNQIIEDNLYRVHLADGVPILAQLMHEALILLGIFSVVNVIALLLIDFIWRRHVNSILRFFMQFMGKTYHLDFTTDPEISDRHQVLDLAAIQRDQDRTRLTEIRKQLSRLDPAMLEENDVQGVHDVMKVLDALLPQPATTPTAKNANALD